MKRLLLALLLLAAAPIAAQAQSCPWSSTGYYAFPDQATATTVATGLGMVMPADGSIPAGDGNFAMVAPMPPPWVTPPVFAADGSLTTPGVAQPGFWAMARINTCWSGYAAAQTALAPYVQTLASPPLVFQ